MPVEAWLTISIVLVVLLLLALTRLPADAVLMGGLTLLMILPTPTPEGWRLGVLSTERALLRHRARADRSAVHGPVRRSP